MKMLKITAKRDGFRRGGIEHAGTAEHPVSKFTKEQLAQIRAEPMLVVEEFEAPDPEPEKTAKSEKSDKDKK